MKVTRRTNREAIDGTRPWKVLGEGPTQTVAGHFKENADYTAADIRFTTNGAALYAITLGEPRGQTAIASLGRASGHAPRGIRSARLLGVSKPLAFQQTDAALVLEIPEKLPTRHASVIKLALA